MRLDIGQVLAESPGGSPNRPCPISPDGRCMLDLIRSQTAIWHDPHGQHYSAREIRLLHEMALWLRAARPERLRAIEVLLEDLVRAVPEPDEASE